ncbi:MAG: peroxiredoxin [Schleiferiaceae bacterium]|nr:peroxiredoxin [Schleiferiaceae bacterium]
MKVAVGSQLPNFELQDQNGKLFSSKEITGKQPIVIYFYPKDNTSGCTAEACSFRDAFDDFKNLDALIVGISSDTVSSHAAFAKRYKLPFTLLADTKNTVRKQFGVPTNLFGLISGRVTYVFDTNGVCKHVFNSQINAKAHVTEALAALKSK